MIRKNLSYDVHKLSKNYHISLKRSHAYELIAAHFGYSSLAAMDSSGFMRIQPTPINFDEQGSPSCVLARFLQLGYNATEAELATQAIVRFVDEQNIRHIEYPSSVDESWELEDLDKKSIEEIEHLSANQPGAKYTLACINKIDQPSEGDSYWYKKKQQGIDLSPAQEQFAVEYEAQLNQFNVYYSLLDTAANSGHGPAAFDLAELGGPDAQKYYQQAAESGCTEAQEFLGLSCNEINWKVEAAKGGSRECLEELARSSADKNDELSAFDAHMWTALARLYGFDLTQSLADNDEDYGPVFVIYEGIHLPSIASEMKVKASAEAHRIFQQYS